MKKVLSLVMAFVLALTITISATAATFVPSIENKGAPELIILDETDEGFVVGYITDKNGDKLTTEYLECFIITFTSINLINLVFYNKIVYNRRQHPLPFIMTFFRFDFGNYFFNLHVWSANKGKKLFYRIYATVR